MEILLVRKIAVISQRTPSAIIRIPMLIYTTLFVRHLSINPFFPFSRLLTLPLTKDGPKNIYGHGTDSFNISPVRCFNILDTKSSFRTLSITQLYLIGLTSSGTPITQ